VDPVLAGLLGALIGAGVALAGSLLQARTARLQRRDQYRLAALDRRLQAHQEAFTLWTRVLWSISEASVSERAGDAQEWWIQNCLYLDPAASEAFRKAFLTAPSIRHTDDLHLRKLEMADVMRVGDLLLTAVSLPPIAEPSRKIATGA